MVEVKQSLREYLNPEDILCQVTERDGMQVLKELLNLLKRTFQDLDIGEATDAVLKREEVFPTVVAPGLAIPHTRLPNLKHPLLAVACSPDGMDFPTPDIKVNVMVLLLTPLDEPNLHLKMISTLAQFFADENAIVKAAQQTTPKALIDLFTPESTGIPEYLTAGDVMIQLEPVNMNAPVASVLEKLSTSRYVEFPVVDDQGILKGEISMADLLRYCIPPYFQWMEDLSPIGKFQQLADFLNKASDTRVIDVMRGNDFSCVPPNTPVARLALEFIKNKLTQILIVDKNKKYLGAVELRSFCAKFFWE